MGRGTRHVFATSGLRALLTEGGTLLGSHLQCLGLELLIDQRRRQIRLGRRGLWLGTRTRHRQRFVLWWTLPVLAHR